MTTRDEPASEAASASEQTAGVDHLEAALALLAAARSPGHRALADNLTERAGAPFRTLAEAIATHVRLSVSIADHLTALPPDEREQVRAEMAATVMGLLDRVDTAEAGCAVTALSVGTNTLRGDRERFRRVADDLIARYLTTGRYHESHEGFVTLSLLAEQYLYAMADATTGRHDVLDDAFSSNTRTIANLTRGLAYYGQRIAEMPDSSYRNAGRVLRDEADPRAAAQIMTALMAMHNRMADLSPGARQNAFERFWSGVDTAVLDVFAKNMAALAFDALAANPDVEKILVRAAATCAKNAAKAVLRSLASRWKR